jgi:hypothetical protein
MGKGAFLLPLYLKDANQLRHCYLVVNEDGEIRTHGRFGVEDPLLLSPLSYVPIRTLSCLCIVERHGRGRDLRESLDLLMPHETIIARVAEVVKWVRWRYDPATFALKGHYSSSGITNPKIDKAGEVSPFGSHSPFTFLT